MPRPGDSAGSGCRSPDKVFIVSLPFWGNDAEEDEIVPAGIPDILPGARDLSWYRYAFVQDWLKANYCSVSQKKNEKMVVPPATTKRKALTQTMAPCIIRKDAQRTAVKTMRYKNIHVRYFLQQVNEKNEMNAAMMARVVLTAIISPRKRRNDAQSSATSTIRKKKIHVRFSGKAHAESMLNV
jgi:hypothetical protein